MRSPSLPPLLIVTLTTVLADSSSATQAAPPSDLILHDGKIFTADTMIRRGARTVAVAERNSQQPRHPTPSQGAAPWF